MLSVVQNVRAEVTITFSDARSFTLPVSDGQTDLKNYCSSIDIDEQLYKSSSNNIVGNICGNTLSLSLVSADKLLIPNNNTSTYYGLMNDTAYVDIYFTVVESNTRVYMGRYYVDTWEGGTDSSRPNEVSISAVDLFGKIKNIPLGKVRIQKNISFIDYIETIKNYINTIVPNCMQIQWNTNYVDIYRNSRYAWQMEYNNFDRDTLEALFNNIAKDSISYIWIDRDRYIRTDHLLDDSGSESVVELSGSTNLLTYNMQTGDIDKYSGVSVKYINNITSSYDELLSMNNVDLFGDDVDTVDNVNTLSDRKMNQSTVDDISLIQVVCDGDETKQGNCLAFDWYKDTITLYVSASENCVANIKVWGTYIIEDYATITKYKNDNNKDAVIEIENRTLRRELINTYIDGLLNLMSMKNNMVEVQGFIDPTLKCGDTVRFIGARFSIDDYYKVTGLKFSLSGGSYRCTASLLKVISTDENVDDILFPYNEALKNTLGGIIINPSGLPNLTNTEEEACEAYIGDLIEDLIELGV